MRKHEDDYDDFETEIERAMGSDADDDILGGIEERDTVRRSHKKPVKHTPKAKKEPYHMSKQTKGMIIFFAASILIAFGCYKINEYRLSKQQEVPPIKDVTYYEGNPYSKDEMAVSIDEDLLGTYKFLLHGEYKAMDNDSNSGEALFTFNADDSYFGKSSKEPDDFGTYELSATTEGVILTVKCTGVTDVYYMELTEDGDIILTDLNNKKYALYKA